MRLGASWIVVLGCAALGVPAIASAQRLAPNAPPAFGAVQVNGTPRPDPMVIDGTVQGRVELSSGGPNCRGYSQEAPSHVVMTQGVRFLAIMVNAPFDSTLFVQTSDGQIWCNDDTDGTQPRLEMSPPPGPIRIWVGSYSPGSGGAYRLGISSNLQVRGAQLGTPMGGGSGQLAVAPPGAAITANAPPLYGVIRMTRGAPAVASGNSGGPIDASQFGGNCRGWVTPQPSHVVNTPGPFPSLRVMVNANHDTTLVVQTADGRTFCDDDSGGSNNPLVQLNGAPAGPMRIWVGSYSSGNAGPYTVGVTENAGMTPPMLGQPTVVAPPPSQPPVVAAQPPSGAYNAVQLMPRIPVTVFGPGMQEATFAVWSPRGGPRIELGVSPSGGSLAVSARVNGTPISLVNVPNEIARDAIVTVTQQPRDRVLVRAERPPGGPGDGGAQMLLILQYPSGASAPVVAQQWVGTFNDRAPRWAR